MAKAQQEPAASPPAYDDEATYAVLINRVVSVGRMKLYPIDAHEITGAALKRVIAEHGEEAIDDVRPIG